VTLTINKDHPCRVLVFLLSFSSFAYLSNGL
jgi:hypothetical protein